MLEEKIETLTKEVVALRQAIEKNGTGKAVAAEEAKPTRKRAPAKKKDEPEHDQDEVGAIFRKAAKEDIKACRAYLKKQKCDDLADLLTKPEEYDAAFTFAESILEPEEEPEEEEAEDDDI